MSNLVNSVICGKLEAKEGWCVLKNNGIRVSCIPVENVMQEIMEFFVYLYPPQN